MADVSGILVVLSLAAIPAVSFVAAFFIDNKIVKGILCGISFIGFSIIAFAVGFFFSWTLLGEYSFSVSFIVFATIYLISMLYIWGLFKLKTRRIVAISIAGAAIVLSVLPIIPRIYRSSLPQSREEIYLPDYAPFGNYWYVDDVLTHHETLAESLGEDSKLKLEGDLPRLDGATALYPLYSAFVRETYPAPEPSIDIPEYFPYADLRDQYNGKDALVVCSRTAGAFENLIDGYADIIFLMGISDDQQKMADVRGLELVLTPIGIEAFVFFVNSRNSIENLSTDDIKRIYSGEVTNWREVGGKNNAIRAYQRPYSSGSQTMLKQIMGDVPIAPAPMDDTFDMMMGMYEQVANYTNYRNSLGYSFLYYIRDMIGENKVKFLSIDGIAPTPESIASGAYPFANDFYAITVLSEDEYLNPERSENINSFIEWILSPQGQYLVEATGYVPVP